MKLSLTTNMVEIRISIATGMRPTSKSTTRTMTTTLLGVITGHQEEWMVSRLCDPRFLAPSPSVANIAIGPWSLNLIINQHIYGRKPSSLNNNHTR